MVTPSACSTTLIRTSAGSLLRPRFTATTSTSFPPPDASIDPFTPTISIVLPPARAPCQRNSLPGWAWRGGAIRPARARSVGASMAGGSRIAGRGPYGRAGGGGFHRGVGGAGGGRGGESSTGGVRLRGGSPRWNFLPRHESARPRHHPRPDRHRPLLQ